jgi:hypothetical protein
MVPIYVPPADVVPHVVLEEEQGIIRAEGWFHVAGLYYRSAPNADKMRRLEAERRVAERERLAALPACAFCFERITGQVAVVIAMKPVHPSCAARFDAWITGHPSENDPRWLQVTDGTPVEFDREVCTWGSLSLAERKEVLMTKDGQLVGSYPF